MDEQIKPVVWVDTDDLECLVADGEVCADMHNSRVGECFAPLYSQQSIDALRAEVERLKALVRSVGYETLDRAEQAEALAERLAEALALLPDDSGMVEHSPEEGPFMFCCGREVTFDRLHGPICTHDEECWYARMRALRDHDQDR